MPDRVVEVDCNGTCRGFLLGFIASLSFVLLAHRGAYPSMVNRSQEAQYRRLTQPLDQQRLAVAVTPATLAAASASASGTDRKQRMDRASGASGTSETSGASAESRASGGYGTALTPPSRAAVVAACFGGSISFALPGKAESVRRGVIVPLKPDVFVAGTLNGSESAGDWQKRSTAGLAAMSAMGPFAAVEVIEQPSTAKLRAALEKSGYMPQYQVRFGCCSPPRRWQCPRHTSQTADGVTVVMSVEWHTHARQQPLTAALTHHTWRTPHAIASTPSRSRSPRMGRAGSIKGTMTQGSGCRRCCRQRSATRQPIRCVSFITRAVACG